VICFLCTHRLLAGCAATGQVRRMPDQCAEAARRQVRGGRARTAERCPRVLPGLSLRLLATEAGVPVVKLNEGGRHTGNSLMYDAEIRPDLVMRRVGHASQEMSQRYNHPERQAHLVASARVTALVSGAGNGS
jgi:integrase